MTTNKLINLTEDELRTVAAGLTDIRPGECMLCYVYRMLEFGCTGLRWATHYRDVRAPKVRDLNRKLGRLGGFCDCEIFMNAFEPGPAAYPPRAPIRMDDDEPDDDAEREMDAEWPAVMPRCRGAVPGSISGCALWVCTR